MPVRRGAHKSADLFLPDFFFFNDTATTEIYTLSLHDALPILHAGPQRAAAQVDRQGHDLDAELFLEPGDGDRCIETTRIGEDDLIHGFLGPPERDWIDSNRSRQRSRRAASAKRTRSVLSPASVPSCSRRLDSSIAWAMTLAVPGVPVSTRISPLRPMVTGMSPRIRSSRSSEAAAAVATEEPATASGVT